LYIGGGSKGIGLLVRLQSAWLQPQFQPQYKGFGSLCNHVAILIAAVSAILLNVKNLYVTVRVTSFLNLRKVYQVGWLEQNKACMFDSYEE